MLYTGDTILKIDIKTNEIVDASVITMECKWLGFEPIIVFKNGTEAITQSRISINNLFRYEKLTKDHEQRYKEFLHKQTINNWFANKEFSFEEKEAIFNSFNVVLATQNDRKLFFETIENEREPNKEMVKAFNNRNKFYTHD